MDSRVVGDHVRALSLMSNPAILSVVPSVLLTCHGSHHQEKRKPTGFLVPVYLRLHLRL